MSPIQRFLARSALRGFQLFCLLFVFAGLANFKPLIAAVEDSFQGEISITDLCWKILPVTAPLIPSLVLIVFVEFILRRFQAPSHELGKPWMADPMWKAKHIRLNNRSQFWILTSFCLGYFGIAVPIAIASEKTPFMIFFGVFGLVLIAMARLFWLNRKWNRSELRMADVPGVIGGPFSGVVILQQAFAPGTAFEVCLKCLQTISHRSDSGDHGPPSTTETLWSSTLHIDKPLPADSPNRTLIPFSFAIPYECESTSDWKSRSSTSIQWNLVVNQKNAISTGGAVFPVPVYKTINSRRDYELDEDFIEPFQQEVDVQALLSQMHMTRQPLVSRGERLTFSHWNQKTLIAVCALMFGCTAVIVACFWFIPQLDVAAFTSLFPGVFVLGGGCVLLDMFFWRSQIEIDHDELRCASGWLGFRKTLATRIQSKPTFVSVLDFRKENGEWYRVELHATEKDQPNENGAIATLVLINRLDGRAEAEAIQGWLSHQCLERSRDSEQTVQHSL